MHPCCMHDDTDTRKHIYIWRRTEMPPSPSTKKKTSLMVDGGRRGAGESKKFKIPRKKEYSSRIVVYTINIFHRDIQRV